MSNVIFRGTARALIESSLVNDLGWRLPPLVVMRVAGDTDTTAEMFNENLHSGLRDRMRSAWAGELDTWGVEVEVVICQALGTELVVVSMFGPWEYEERGEVPYVRRRF